MLVKFRPGKIKVIGIGNAGTLAARSLAESECGIGIEFLYINREGSLINNSHVDTIQFKDQSTASTFDELASYWKGLFQEYKPLISDKVKDADVVFLVCGEGKDFSTTIAPLVAEIVQEYKILSIAVVTKPFFFEGRGRMNIANDGIEDLEKNVDTIITIPLQNIFDSSDKGITLTNTLRQVYTTLYSGVSIVLDLITHAKYINVDLADIRTIMKESGRGYIGEGRAQNSDIESIEHAMNEAITSPYIERSVKDAKKIIINIKGSSDLPMHAIDAAVVKLNSQVDPNAEIIFGLTLDSDISDEVKVSVIATDFRATLTRRTFDFVKDYSEKDFTINR